MTKVIYNYTFISHTIYNGQTSFLLQSGGAKIGTMMSGGWLFDGQIFTRSQERPYNGRIYSDNLKIVVVEQS